MQRRDYIVQGRESIPGWFDRGDAELFNAIDQAQQSAGVVGDLLEIGCFQGASAILLGYLRRENERLVICDLFQESPSSLDEFHRRRDVYAGLSRSSFEANYLRFHAELPEIFAQSSTTLSSAGLERTFRFIHVDGSHDYEDVRADLLLAKSLLVPGGFVVFDDIITLHAPGVTAAVWEGVVRDELTPLYQTSKLYATWGDPLKVDIPKEFNQFTHEVSGHTMAHLEYLETRRSLMSKVRRRLQRALRERRLRVQE
jgi:SAM-dependent methyltransferase